METKQRRKIYSCEFKQEAVRLVRESDQSLAAVARDLGIDGNSLRNRRGRCVLRRRFARFARRNLATRRAETGRLRGSFKPIAIDRFARSNVEKRVFATGRSVWFSRSCGVNRC